MCYGKTLAFLDFALENRAQTDDAPERIVVTVEHESLERFRFVESDGRRRRYPFNDGVEHRFDPETRLCAQAQDFRLFAAEEVRKLSYCRLAATVVFH